MDRALVGRAFLRFRRPREATQIWVHLADASREKTASPQLPTRPSSNDRYKPPPAVESKKPWYQRIWAEEVSFGHVFLFLPVALGTGAAIWFALPFEPPLVQLWSACLLLAAACLLGRAGYQKLSLAAAIPGLLAGGMLLARFESDRLATIILDSPVTTTVTGVVERREAVGDQRWRYVLNILETSGPKLKRAPERVALIVRGKTDPLQTGAVVRGRARLTPPSGPALPGLSDFSFPAYFDGIGATGFFYGSPEILGAREAIGVWQQAVQFAFALRSYVGDRIRQLNPGDEGAFAAAIVTDERRAISPTVVEALRSSGLAHIVAISGLNMALAAGIFFVGLRTVLVMLPGVSARLPVKKVSAFGALLMVTAYYCISGFGVSAERAYIMMAILLIAILFNRPSLSMHNIALAALVIIVLHPSSVMGASFQMSFAATAALLACYRIWADRAHESDQALVSGISFRSLLSGVSRVLGGTLMTSLIGGLATAVFSIAHFNQLTAYGLAANLATMPIISLIVMPSGLIGMLLMPFGLDQPFFMIMSLGLKLVIAVALEVASWGGNIETGRAASWLLPVATAGLIIFSLLRTRLRWFGLVILVASVCVNGLMEPSRPDLVIAEDGRMAALLSGASASVTTERPSEFVFKQWKNALGLKEFVMPVVTRVDVGKREAAPESNAPVTRTVSGKTPRHALTSKEIALIDKALAIDQLPPLQMPRFSCVKNLICIGRSPSGARVTIVSDTRLTGYACDKSDIVVVSGSPFTQCRSGALLLTGSKLKQTGSIEIWFNGQPHPGSWMLVSALQGNERPWQLHRLYDWRTNTFQPLDDETIRRLRVQ
ncbi:ComEC/Rec2 family competence protein [Rhizobium rhizoryzae]|uniref:ComEC/Rec2 family competence protein n=1 Tax=Rhizobium rhizoryzae TaxID=451876 RepID=UPI00406B9745